MKLWWLKKGEEYVCEVCGLAVNIVDECGCEECAIVCCEVPNEEKRII